MNFKVGITHNIKLRFHQHNNSDKNTFTAKHRPWILKAAFRCKNREQAAWCEKYIKQQKSKKFIEDVLLNDGSEHPLFNVMKRV